MKSVIALGCGLYLGALPLSGFDSDKPATRTDIAIIAYKSPGPVLIYVEAPEYTEAAKAAGIEGIVRLAALVDVDGLVKEARVTRPLDPGLDQKAIEVVHKWRFRPAQGTEDGRPVPSRVTLDVRFILPRRE